MSHLTILEVQVGQAQALTRVNDRLVRRGEPAAPLQDPRVLAARLERAACRARVSLLVNGEDVYALVDEVAAWASALRMSLHSAHLVRVDTGDDGPVAA